MNIWPEIDWLGFAQEVDGQLVLASRAGISLRAIQAAHRISIATLTRARAGATLSAANYLALCQMMDIDPYRYLTSGQTRSLRSEVSRGNFAETI